MKLVLVEWIDSHSNHGWNPLDRLEEDCEPLHIRSVGWLLCKKKGYIQVVPHISGEKEDRIVINGTGEIAIPEKAILKITTLRK